MIELRKVDLSNFRQIIGLTVAEGQKKFVASNTASILEAYATQASGYCALPFGMYHDGVLVGFVMFGYDTIDEDDPQAARGNYCIWRFMIAKEYQGQGLGKEGLQACLAFLRGMPCGPAEGCWLSYEPDNVRAKALYTGAGFCENGETCEGEVVAVYRF